MAKSFNFYLVVVLNKDKLKLTYKIVCRVRASSLIIHL